MDCLQCVVSLNSRPKPIKQKSSKKYGEVDLEPEREWPVDPHSYEILHKAGAGGTAVVYCARCKPLDEVVAVKKLDLDSRANYDLTALTREATLMRKLQHPNVLPLHTSFVTGRELWMIMPHMAYGSVRSIMKREGFTEGLDEVVIATIMRCVLEGLNYVHQNGGIHRDVKADNVLISESGEVRLADFGVAAARARPVSMINLDMEAVMATTFVGTPCWMAPEVMRQEDGYNSSADIWSFGITMIELATGRPPLARCRSPMRVLMDTINNPAPSLDHHSRGHCYSKSMKEVVDACLNKDPFERPSAADLLSYKFFKMARDEQFLVEHFLSGLTPPVNVREAAAAAAAEGVGAPELLGGMLRGKSAMGLQDLAMGRIGSVAGHIKSSWYFPGAKSLANMANLRKPKRSDEEETPDEHAEDAAAAEAAAAAAEQAEAEALAACIVGRTSSSMAAAAEGFIGSSSAVEHGTHGSGQLLAHHAALGLLGMQLQPCHGDEMQQAEQQPLQQGEDDNVITPQAEVPSPEQPQLPSGQEGLQQQEAQIDMQQQLLLRQDQEGVQQAEETAEQFLVEVEVHLAGVQPALKQRM